MLHFFQFSVSWSSEMEVGVIYFETYGSTQPHVAFCTLIFHSCCCVYTRTCTAPSSLAFQRPVFVVSVSSLFNWLMDGLVFLALWSEFQAPSPPLAFDPSPTSVWMVSVTILNVSGKNDNNVENGKFQKFRTHLCYSVISHVLITGNLSVLGSKRVIS